MASEPQLGDAATLGGYEVLYQLKAGGMGEVLLARRHGPSGFERLAALKTIRSELRGHDPLRRMFLDEAQLLARLSHPGIAQIFDFGEDEGVLYLAMEYVAGVRFRDLVSLSPPPVVSARAMAEVCRALHAAHELSDLAGHPLGVVHRDVSPDNLMLTFGGQVKVLDFGIALMRGRHAPVTEFGTVKGKPPYLSPEQIKNQSVDRRTDVFAASAVLHELLTGAQVFEGDSVYAIARAIELDEVAPPSATAGTLPPGLDHAVMRGLDRDLDRRWQSADELARALDQVVAAAEGESLGEYAARQLGDEHRRHREWLRSVLEPDASQGARAGRPSGIMTAPARAAILDDVPTLDGTRPGRGRRRGVVAGLAAVVAVGGVALWVATESGPRASKVGLPESQPRVSELGPQAVGEGGGERVIAFDAGAVTLSVPPVAGADEVPETTPVRESSRKTRRASQSRKPRPGARSRSGTGTGTISGSGPGPGSGSGSEPGPGSESAPIGAGTITLRTQPGTQWAEVRIDGKDVGDTPMKREIAVGSHDIEFVRPDKDEVRYRRTVQVAAGQHVEVVAP